MRALHRTASILLCLALVVLVACGEPAADRPGSTEIDSVPGDLALPPSADSPRVSTEGHAPDTVRPEPADTHRHLSPAELDADSIATSYRNYYRSEFVDRRADPGGEAALVLDPEVVEAAQRRTALEWGYVELDAWEHLLADLSDPQRLELAQRIDEFHRSLGATP